MRKITALVTCLLFACAAQAQNQPADRAAEGGVRQAVEEAVSVHAIATAARLCNLISEGELTRATSRMTRVHTAQLGQQDQETYLILRSSESFRNMVFATALRRAQGSCTGDLAAVWRDVESTLVSADLKAGSTLAASSMPALAR